ncbi:hypothetical protein Gohar_004793, partial [Gossypium harknessii]|nr:hypothetical protein [Gossypium harknessii]
EAVERGVLRDHHGQWIIGFNKRLGICFVFNAKLWGILDGLTILYNRNRDKVSIQMKSVEEMIHTPREENIKADNNTKLAFNRDEGSQLFVENPLII